MTFVLFVISAFCLAKCLKKSKMGEYSFAPPPKSYSTLCMLQWTQIVKMEWGCNRLRVAGRSYDLSFPKSKKVWGRLVVDIRAEDRTIEDLLRGERVK